MKAYRFNTLKELEDAFGSDWREDISVYFSENMDKFLGQKLTNEENLEVWEELQCQVDNGDNEELLEIEIDIRGYTITGEVLEEDGTFAPAVKTKYRIRTAAEFEKEHGEDWRDNLDDYFPERMDYLLGKILDTEENLKVARCLDQGHGYTEIDNYEIYPSYLIETTGCCLSGTTSLNPSLFKRKSRVRVNQGN